MGSGGGGGGGGSDRRPTRSGDFIAFGGFQSTRAGFRYLKDTFIEMGYSDCYWLRTETGKIGFHRLKEN